MRSSVRGPPSISVRIEGGVLRARRIADDDVGLPQHLFSTHTDTRTGQ